MIIPHDTAQASPPVPAARKHSARRDPAPPPAEAVPMVTDLPSANADVLAGALRELLLKHGVVK
jgi:hypothetical protein